MIAAAGLLLGLFILVLSDLLLQWGRLARGATCLALLAAIGVTLWWLRRSLKQPLTPQAVAASVEQAFPELDNHLINYLQFADNPSADPFKTAYLKRDIPGWSRVNVTGMKNHRLHRWAIGALSVALVVILLPTAFSGRAWAVAMWRVTNPFSNAKPISLTHIVSVSPGTTTARQGEPLGLTCTVTGRRGHSVLLDIKPADGDATTYTLGTIEGEPTEGFSHHIPLLSTGLRYRFRAGDAPFPAWFEITPRPPLAFTALTLSVTPPSHTGIAPTILDGLAASVEIPDGSHLALRLACNGTLDAASAQLNRDTPVPLQQGSGEDARWWSGGLMIDHADGLLLSATDSYGETIEAQLQYTLLPDRPPVIQILAPTGRTALPPGAQPTIDFVVDDDYGLADVTLERIAPGGPSDAPGSPVTQWVPTTTSFSMLWSEAVDAADGRSMAFRIVARDNHPLQPHIVHSPTILFNATSLADMATTHDKQEQATRANLGTLIEMQRDNISRTRACQTAVVATTAEQWGQTTEQQRRIRLLMRDLLATPGEPLGSLTPTAKRLYLNDMQQVIDTLARIPTAPDRAVLATRAINTEEKILRQLTYAEVAAAQTRVEQRISALSGMLATLISGETQVIKTTRHYITTAATVGEAIVDQQDDLAADLTEFMEACRRESAAIAANDQVFAALLIELAAQCESTRIRDDMTLAAEALDGNKPAAALPDEQQALAKLQAVQTRLNAVATSEVAAQEEEMLDVLEHAKEKFRKVREMHQRALESIEMVKEQNDDSDEMVDLMEEEYQELVKNTKAALLEVPTDLHIFKELNAANDLVEDVFSIFEEVAEEEEKAQSASEKDGEEVTEKAYAKREELLEKMEEMEGRFDKLEEWLGQKAENDVITTEAFDQDELPEDGVAMGALAAEAEDLIGDLLEEADEGADKAKDSATNHAVPDDPGLGWEVKEGDLASFAAKGKSGNQVPDHKEQDGRSNVGRQGMAVGENASGSGTLGEGDSDIEARRTQDPTQDGQVDLDGEANVQATGGGKQASGKAGEEGMAGGTRRMDSTEAGSMEGLEALMAQQADAMYTKASLKNVRADSLKDAAHHLRQAADAIANGQPIEQIKEHRHRAVVALKRAKTQLEAGPSATLTDAHASALLDGVVSGGPDEAPSRYRDLVADYYKKLNEAL